MKSLIFFVQYCRIRTVFVVETRTVSPEIDALVPWLGKHLTYLCVFYNALAVYYAL